MSRKSAPLTPLQRKMPSIGDPCGVRRVTALVLGFHAKCRDECRRAKNCVGAGAPCFDAFWWGLPEIQKDIFREMVKARVAGAGTAEEIENAAFARIMAVYSPEQILAAAEEVRSPRPARNTVREQARPEPVLPRARIL